MSVNYYTIDDKGVETPHKGHACFSVLRVTTMPFAVRYHAAINGYVKTPKLISEDVKTFDAFIHELFDTITTHAFTSKVEKDEVIYLLKTQGMPFSRVLTYLTAMRYVDEQPAIVQAFAALKETDLEARFVAFRKLHSTVGGYNLLGHGLMYPSYERPGSQATVAKLRANLLQADLPNVFSHFATKISS